MSDLEAFDLWWMALPVEVRLRMNHADALYGWVSAISYMRRKDDGKADNDNT